jgi:hypothetical protein
MGIRFYCPNGHKLNVKEFQRGLRGICPFCGARVRIPLKSTRRSSHAEKFELGGTMPTSPSAELDLTAETPLRAAVSPTPESMVPSSDVAEEPPGPFSVFATSEDSYPDATVESPARSSAAAAPPDLLAEAGSAAWFVRPPSGGQFGPATADVLRTWLAEGRLTADTALWHEGWPDWRAAGELFPQLTPKLTIPGLDDFYAEPDASASHNHASQRHDRPRSPHAVTVGVMILLGLVLSLTLLAVAIKLF